MKIQPDKFDVQHVDAYADDWISIGGAKYHSSLVFNSAGNIWHWSCSSFQALTVDDFHWLASLKPQLLILGTGLEQHFPAAELMYPLIQLSVGCEIMNSQAACRTYNILAQEGREVMCAVII